MKKGREFEVLIEMLYKKLDSQSMIKRNDKLLGHDSKIEREIDVSIRHKIGLHEILMIVQAKDYQNKVDVNVVGEFNAVIKDVKANKGIIISAKGFTTAALNLAKSLNIDALTGHDLNNPKWAIDLKMPVILSVYNGGYTAKFIFEASQEYADLVNGGVVVKSPPIPEMRITEDEGKTFHTINEKFNFLCGYGHLKHYDGEENEARFSGQSLKLFITEGVLTPLRDFRFIYKVTKKVFYKYFEVKEFQGLINQVSNDIGRANLRIESDEFSLINYDIIEKKQIDLSTWLPYDESVKLIHPYKIECMLIGIGVPKGPITWEFLGEKYANQII